MIIMFKTLENKDLENLPTEHREFKPVETDSVNEAGRFHSLEWN